jgi:pilus assembly protein CpaE
VATPEVTALRRTHSCLRLLQGLEFPTSKLHLVLNRVQSKTRISTREAIEALGQSVTWQVANDFAAMQAAALGQPVVLSKPNAKLSRDIRGIAQQLAGVPTVTRGRWMPWRRRGTALVTA